MGGPGSGRRRAPVIRDSHNRQLDVNDPDELR